MSCFLDGFESETLRVLSCSTVVRIHAVSALSALWCDRQPGLAERAHEQRGKEQKRECLSHKKTSHSSISRSISQVLPGFRSALPPLIHAGRFSGASSQKPNDSVCLLMQKSPSSNAKVSNLIALCDRPNLHAQSRRRMSHSMLNSTLQKRNAQYETLQIKYPIPCLERRFQCNDDATIRCADRFPAELVGLAGRKCLRTTVAGCLHAPR